MTLELSFALWRGYVFNEAVHRAFSIAKAWPELDERRAFDLAMYRAACMN